MLIQVSLELDRASAQYVVLTGFVDGGDGNVQRREISRVDARTERHVREALERIGRDIQQTTIGDVGNARPPARRPKFGRRRSDKD